MLPVGGPIQRVGGASQPLAGAGPAGPGPNYQNSRFVGAFKHGGKVKRTGLAKVHAGERVLTKKQARTEKREHKGKEMHSR